MMNDQLNKDIKAAIAKSLPAALAEELQQVLKEGTDAIGLVAVLQNSVTHQDNVIKELENKLCLHNKLSDREKAVATKEQAVLEAERNAKVVSLEVQLEAQKSMTKFAQDLAMGLVRNTEYRKSVFDSETKNVPFMGPGGYMMNQAVNNTKALNENTEAT